MFPEQGGRRGIPGHERRMLKGATYFKTLKESKCVEKCLVQVKAGEVTKSQRPKLLPIQGEHVEYFNFHSKTSKQPLNSFGNENYIEFRRSYSGCPMEKGKSRMRRCVENPVQPTWVACPWDG